MKVKDARIHFDADIRQVQSMLMLLREVTKRGGAINRDLRHQGITEGNMQDFEAIRVEFENLLLMRD